MNRERDNRIKPVPADPHPDKAGRAAYILSKYPKHGADRLVSKLDLSKGHIRGEAADTLFNALRPYLEERAQGRQDSLPIVETWAVEAPLSGESRNFRSDTFDIKG